jgi:hypothetical protein
MLSVLAAIAAFTSGTAFAQAPQGVPGAVTLVAPPASPVKITVSGVAWRCGVEGCLGPSDWYSRYASLDPLKQGCRDLARAVGPVRDYSYGGRLLSREDVADCNRTVLRRDK